MNYKVNSALSLCCKRDQFYRISDYAGPNDPSNTSAGIRKTFLSLPVIQEGQLTCMCDLISVPHVISSSLEHCFMRKLMTVGSLNNLKSEAEFRVICNGSLEGNSIYLAKCIKFLNLKKEDSHYVLNSKSLKGVIFITFQERFDSNQWAIEKIILSKSGTNDTTTPSTTILDSEHDIVICGFTPTIGGPQGFSVQNRVALLSMLYERTAKRNQFDGSLQRAANITTDSVKFIEYIKKIKEFLATDIIITQLWTESRTFVGSDFCQEELEMRQIELAQFQFALTIFVAGNLNDVLRWNSTPLGYGGERLDWVFYQGMFDRLKPASDINNAFMGAFELFCAIDINQYFAKVAQCAEDNFLSYIADKPLEKNRRYTAFSIFPRGARDSNLKDTIVPPCKVCTAHFFNDIGLHLFGENNHCTATFTSMYGEARLSF
ncbi:hypothetical protein EON65_39870 [archaeon]|nr:MAG: hypothetical protein EON65_39870 [archaeon]